jgi:hypothetical protein
MRTATATTSAPNAAITSAATQVNGEPPRGATA